MPSRPVIKTFNAGLLSPLLAARTDIEKYSSGCQKLQNMIPLTQGAATRRMGSEYVNYTKYDNKKSRLISFARSDEISYMLEWGDHYIRVYDDGFIIEVNPTDLDTYDPTYSYIVGDWVTDGTDAFYCIQAGIGHAPSNTNYWIKQTIYEIYTPYTHEEVADIQVVQSQDVMYVVHPNHKIYKLSSTGATDFTMKPVKFTYAPFKDENIESDQRVNFIYNVSQDTWVKNIDYPKDAIVKYAGSFYQADRHINEFEDYDTPASAPSGIWTDIGSTFPTEYPKGSVLQLHSEGLEFSTGDVGKSFLIKKPREDNSLSQSLSATGDTTDTMDVKGTWNIVTHGTWDGTIEIQKSNDNFATNVMVRTYGSTGDRNVDANGEEPQEGFKYRVQFTQRNSGTVTVDFNVEEAFIHTVFDIVGFIDNNNVLIQIRQDEKDTSSTMKYTAWSIGAWGGDAGYPIAVAFFEERLCFGGNAEQPLTVWTSKTNDYENLTSGSLATDSLLYTLASDKVFRITWMQSQKMLLIGTTGDEWRLGGSKTSEPMTPTSVRAERQSSYGSERINSLLINSAIMYVQRGGAKLREMTYDYRSELFISPDLTALVQNVTQSGVKDMTYTGNPYPIIWFVRNDGIMLGFTYETEQKVYAWHIHITEGEFESVDVIPEGEYDYLWAIVKRGDKRIVERFYPLQIPNQGDDYKYLDSAIEVPKGYYWEITTSNEVDQDPFTFNIPNHDMSDGDFIRVYPTESADPNFPYEEEVFRVRVIDNDNFVIQNEDGSYDWKYADHPYSFVGQQFLRVYNRINISRFPHLMERELALVSDNVYIGMFTSDSAGYIDLPDYYSNMLVGFNYVSILKPMDFNPDMADGSASGLHRRISDVDVWFYRTIGGSVITDDGYETIIPFRIAQDKMDTAIPLFTGHKSVRPNMNHRKSGGIEIKQDIPNPMTVLSIQAWLTVYN